MTIVDEKVLRQTCRRTSAVGEQLALAHVLVVGDVMLDRYWFGDTARISPEAPVPVVHVQRCEERPGGAANVACNIAVLGAQASLIGVVGDDEAGRQLDKLLAESGVAAYLERDCTRLTTVKLRVVSRQQQLLRVDFEKKVTPETPSTGLTDFKALLAKQAVVLLSDYGKGYLAPYIADMIATARSAGKPVLVDPKSDDWTSYRGATLITPNRAELRAVTGNWQSEDDLRQRVTQLCLALDIEALLLTRSEEGMTLYHGEHVLHINTVASEVYDVAGAGDTVIATLAALLAAGMPLADAVIYANRAAGIVVGKFGAAAVEYEELFPTSDEKVKQV
ncbi:D-glycero-beta-D-manno-heptose-7-phosphate kinase [Mycoavidus sp. B2-EB]|uniref:D-glycero-beta-D-manno-heptose-7-phosphate kinase n=1 Tax=Mycoavidus sp. B2-EB TaxID=2651972 RepID=UPI0016232B20|nr:D-glycero-beta-D-manno-heptose-7-phosphate kinase [Mycoavidus sp. B2-EB]BBO60059.1 ADP-heptose synthase [Mycoavidus sp. B2-EB]